MKIHEFQARTILQNYNIPLANGFLASSVQDALKAFNKLNKKVVIKAQILSGGRGKAGGIKIADTEEEVIKYSELLLNSFIKGEKVNLLLIVECVSVQKEFYLGITVDREKKKIAVLLSKEGGVEIEETATKEPEKILKVYIDPILGIRKFHILRMCCFVTDDKTLRNCLFDIIESAYNAFIENNCTLLEINPLSLVEDGHLIALDSKMNIDDNGLDVLPKGIIEHNCIRLDDEYEASQAGLSYIKLDGDIGCIVNGAGLAMATMDMIKIAGGKPANFLDVGGSSNPQKIIKAFELLLRNENLKSILVNIFGGITRCDDVAKGLLKAIEIFKPNIPIVVRLIGTNFECAEKILNSEEIEVFTDLNSAIKKVVQ